MNCCNFPWCGIDGKLCVDCSGNERKDEAVCSRGAVIGENYTLEDAKSDGQYQRCSVCEGMDHHWMPESDDEINDGEPFMVCKHCPATREMAADEELN